MKYKKWLMVLASLAVCMAVFAGCGDDSGSSGGSGASGNSSSFSESVYTVPKDPPSMAGSV